MRRMAILGGLIAVVSGLAFLWSGTPEAHAEPDLTWPFEPGTTWIICRGYNYASHAGGFAFDLVVDGDGPVNTGCPDGAQQSDTNGDGVNDNLTRGKKVTAPVDGTVSYVSGPTVCANIAGTSNKSFRVVHVNPSVSSGAIVKGVTELGTVQDQLPGGYPNNANVSHLHFEMYGQLNCAGPSKPFDSSDGGLKIDGVAYPDLSTTPVGGEHFKKKVSRTTDPGAPVADAGGPYTGDVGFPITFDASGSHDPGGAIILHEWDWTCDGTYDSSIVAPIITHTYTSPYSGCVRLRVTDDDFNTATDTAHVEVNGNRPPVADPNGPYSTNEGTNVQLNGTGSSDPDGDSLTYKWDLDNDGQYDDSTSATPTFTRVGQDGVFTVRLRVSDGEETDTDSTTVTVLNVPPSVSLSSDAPVDEASPVTVTGTVTDPGWLDPLTATIDWDDGTPPEPTGGILENVRPNATLTFSVSHVYGDNGVFTAEVCADDDDTTTCETIDLQIDNVDPTAEIDMSGAILVNGIPTFIAHIGDPVDFSGRSTDPGSDDLYLSWDWDDGSPVVTTTSLVNPPNPDPYPSPSFQPRDVKDMQTYTYADACFYQIEFWAGDDDGGVSPVDTANVIIVGNAEDVRTAGYWLHQYRSHLTGQGRPHFDAPTLGCYLDIAGYMSLVFDEERDASTFGQAHDVLFVKNNSGDMTEMLDQQLLAVWLNFANGSIEYDQMVDTDADKVPDAVFLDAMAAAEAVRLDAGATRMELETKKDFLERLNRMM